jgi:hypothetical protein
MMMGGKPRGRADSWALRVSLTPPAAGAPSPAGDAASHGSHTRHPRLQVLAPPLRSTADVARHLAHQEAGRAAAVAGALQHAGLHVAEAARAAGQAARPAELVDADSAVTWVQLGDTGQPVRIAGPAL